MSFGFTEVVLLICAGLWLLHAVQLAQLPFRRSWSSFVIVALGVGVTLVVWWLVPRWSAAVGVTLVLALLVAPVVLTRLASRELRWGRIDRAQGLAALALLLRPTAAQRRFRRAVDLSWRLGSGKPIDIDAAVESLGPLTKTERRAQRIALLSWTNDFEKMASELADPKVRALAIRAGLAAITTTVVGETASDAGLIAHWLRLEKVPSLRARQTDGTWAMILMAAYFGDEALVADMTEILERDIPPDRRAFALATAQQRAGHPEEAEETIARALASGCSTPSTAARLAYRLDHPRPPLTEIEAAAPIRAEIARRLRVRWVLAELRLGRHQYVPLTSAIAASLCLVFAWQTTQTRKAVFGMLGLLSPYADNPDPYRLLSYAFVHLDFGHLSVNVLGLLFFGHFVERSFGLWRYLIVYLLGAIAGGLSYLIFAGPLPGVAIGASGAVLALFGATMVRLGLDAEVRKTEEGRRILVVLTFIAAAQLALDAVWAQSSGSAHAGGLVAGLVVGAALVPRMRRR